MNREIKFRAWDVENKIMVYDNENDTYGYWDGCQDSDLGMINHLLNRKEYIFMQYTGLKDKNDKKIFEGDIIIAHDTKFIVKFGAYRTQLFKKEYGSAIHTKQFGWYVESIENKEQCNLVIPNGIEVIGNIYEDNLESKGE